MSRELEVLFESEAKNLEDWAVGKIPRHYKRITASEDEQRRLAILGATTLCPAFGIRLYFTQAMISGAILSGDYDEVIVVTPSQYGKAVEDDVPVLTSNGWKRHGDLKVGDRVVAPNGEFVKVIYVHPKCDMDRAVVFENGDEIICHHNHEWLRRYRNTRTGETQTRTISVAEMERRGVKLPNGSNKYIAPVKTALKGEEKALAVHPYVMGAWLGDGSTTKGQICSSPDDIAVLDKCREYYPDGGEWTHKETGVITRSFVGLANDLSTYNMCYQRKDTPEKRIPDEYLTASVEQRLQLLAGLIDTDGYTFHDKRWGMKSRVYFTTAGEALKDSFEALVSTFGWRVSAVEIEPKESTSGIKGKHKYWQIAFSPDMEIPCVLERKRIKGFSKQRGLGICEIKHVEGYQGNCITVEGGEYCVGNHLIPTHNSWLLGHVALYRAWKGAEQYIAAGTTNLTQIIMTQTILATQEASPEIRNSLLERPTDIDRLTTSLSKQKLAFKKGGFVEALSLGDTYGDSVTSNRAVGRGRDFFVDEAALVSEKAFIEMGRREFAKVDGSKYLSVLISNPHRPGVFYDKLTQQNPDSRTLIIWMDALTAVEEGRFKKKQVFESEFAKHRSTLKRYLLCVLDEEAGGMFDTPKVGPSIEADYIQYFIGVDAAYKGKDDIKVAVTACGGGRMVTEAIYTIRKPEWIEGVTSQDIIKEVSRLALRYSASFVCVDVGWGVWLTEGLKQKQLSVKGINFSETPTKERVRAGHYAAVNASNKRAEMHLDLQGLIESGVYECTQEVYNEIKDCLPYITNQRKTSGKITICPKEQVKAIIGHSPDALDAVLLSIHAAIKFLGDGAYTIP